MIFDILQKSAFEDFSQEVSKRSNGVRDLLDRLGEELVELSYLAHMGKEMDHVFESLVHLVVGRVNDQEDQGIEPRL